MHATHKSLLTKVSLLVTTIGATLFASNALACSYIPPGTYALSATVNSGPCVSTSTNTVDAFFNTINTNGLQSLTGTYTGTQDISIFARFNSLDITLGYNVGPQLQLLIPGLGVFETFNGLTRDASEDLFEDYIKKSGILSKILNYQAANSPTSPITGVGGVLPNAVASDFNQNFMDTATNIAAPASAAAAAASGGSTPNLIGIALQYGSFSALDTRTKVTSIPLSYTIRNDIDPRRQLTLSVPLTQVDVDGAKAYIAGFGVSYRVPMNDNWTLTPAGKISGVGSTDLATVAGMYTGSITSTYIWDMNTYNVAMGNMLSYNRTAKIQSGEYSANPDITSTVLRNGVMLSQPANWNGQKLSVEYSLVDTRYVGGTKLYIDNTQEIGITVGTNKNAFSARSFLRGGLTYLRGKDTKGFTANIGYWF
jgi:hypothetical protein